MRPGLSVAVATGSNPAASSAHKTAKSWGSDWTAMTRRESSVAPEVAALACPGCPCAGWHTSATTVARAPQAHARRNLLKWKRKLLSVCHQIYKALPTPVKKPQHRCGCTCGPLTKLEGRFDGQVVLPRGAPALFAPRPNRVQAILKATEYCNGERRLRDRKSQQANAA